MNHAQWNAINGCYIAVKRDWKWNERLIIPFEANNNFQFVLVWFPKNYNLFCRKKKNTELQTNQRRLEGKWKNVKWIHVWLSLKSFLMLSKRDQLPNVLRAGCLECRHCLYTGAGRGINLTISMELEVFYHTGI